MNIAVDEVLNRKIALIEEICMNDDVDGFEINFLKYKFFPATRFNSTPTPIDFEIRLLLTEEFERC